MISAISGELLEVVDDRVELIAGDLTYSLLIPAADVPDLFEMVGRRITLHTMLYMQGDGNVFDPVLVGFIRRDDRRFFELFITVKGVGPKTALRALTLPVGEIAAAIEGKDARKLTSLKGIGKRTAELIVAELAGKVGGFVVGEVIASESARPPKDPAAVDAVDTLVALGDRRADAEALLAKARAANPKLTTAEQLVQAMLSMRGSR